MSTAENIPETPQAPPPSTGHDSPAAQWFSRLGLSGKLLLFGAVAGIIVAFFPLVSVSVNGGEQRTSFGWMVIDDWRGALSVHVYLGVIVLAVLLYPPGRAAGRNLCAAAIGLGAVLVLWSLWMFISATRIGIGFGAILCVLAAATVAAGAVLKAREERLV